MAFSFGFFLIAFLTFAAFVLPLAFSTLAAFALPIAFAALALGEPTLLALAIAVVASRFGFFLTFEGLECDWDGLEESVCGEVLAFVRLTEGVVHLDGLRGSCETRATTAARSGGSGARTVRLAPVEGCATVRA